MPHRVRPRTTGADRLGRVGRSVVAMAVVLAVGSCGSGGDADELVEPEVRRPPGGDPASVATTVPLEPAQDAGASSTTTTTEPVRDVGEFDLAATSVQLLCPGGVVTVALSGEPSDSMVAEVIEDLSHDLDLDGTSERVVLASCRAAAQPAEAEAPEAAGDGGQSSIVALAAGGDGLVQLGAPLPGHAVHDIDTSLVAEDTRTADGNRVTTYVPLTIVDGGLAEGGAGLPLSTADPALPMGLGGLEIGASYALLASNVGGGVTVRHSGTGDECALVQVDDGPEGIRGLGGDGTLASVEVANPDVRTDTGLGIGSSEDEVRFTYGDLLERARDPGDPGREFLVASPPDTDGLTAVFEVADAKVVGYRMGEPGWASALDGCS